METVNNPQDSQPGVVKNSHGGYHIHLKLNEKRVSLVVGGGINQKGISPAGYTDPVRNGDI